MYEELIEALREHADKMCVTFKGAHACGSNLAREAADAIEELLQKEKFHAFLWNVINHKDMQLYLEMYHSSDEKQEARE